MNYPNGTDGIKIDGHRGTWYVLYTFKSPEGSIYHIMEHEQYGDTAEWQYVDDDMKPVSEEIEDQIVDGDFAEVA